MGRRSAAAVSHAEGPSDEAKLIAANERLLARRREFEAQWSRSAPQRPAFAAALPAGIDLPDGPPVFRCVGGCKTVVAVRGLYCSACAEAQNRQMRRYYLSDAYSSLSPSEGMAWCRIGNPLYMQRTARARQAAERLPTPRRARALELLETGCWTRRAGNLLVLGPARIGKTNLITAIGYRILDQALDGGLPFEAFTVAQSLRFVTGLDLARARAQTKFGERPALIGMACAANLLLLDEVGYECDRGDPHAVRDVIYERYRAAGQKTILMTSGCTLDELKRRYSAACIERLTDLGEVIDLHGGAS